MPADAAPLIAALDAVPREPGVGKPDPILIADDVRRRKRYHSRRTMWE